MDRHKLFKKYVKNKSVLDIGSCGFTESSLIYLNYLEANSKNYLCIDNNKNVVNKLKYLYNVKLSDAESFKLNKKFDVIHCGELIEHLSNVGLFLECCKKHLNKDGKILISTPNSYSFRYLAKVLFTGQEIKTYQHSILLSEYTFKELISRYGLNCETIYCSRVKIKGIKEYFEHLIYSLFPKLGSGLFFIVKKSEE